MARVLKASLGLPNKQMARLSETDNDLLREVFRYQQRCSVRINCQPRQWSSRQAAFLFAKLFGEERKTFVIKVRLPGDTTFSFRQYTASVELAASAHATIVCGKVFIEQHEDCGDTCANAGPSRKMLRRLRWAPSPLRYLSGSSDALSKENSYCCHIHQRLSTRRGVKGGGLERWRAAAPQRFRWLEA